MPREVNPPRAYESPLVPRTLSSQPSSISASLKRAGSAPEERTGVSGLRRGGPFSFQNAVVSRGSTLRNSMKPRPSATDAVIVEKSIRSPGSDMRSSKLLTPPSSQEAEGEMVNPSFEQPASFNLMDRENSEVPQSPIHPSSMRRAVSETQTSTSNSHAGPSKPRYSAITFIDDEEHNSSHQSTTPLAAPPALYQQASYFPAGSTLKSSKSRKRNSASQQPENIMTSPNPRSKKQTRRSHPPSGAFSTPQPSSSAYNKHDIAPRTEKPRTSNRRKLDPLSKSLSYPTESSTTSAAARTRRQSTPYLSGKHSKAPPLFVIPDFVPKGTSMDPDPPPPPPSPGDDPILLIGNRSGILSQPPVLDDLEEETTVSSNGEGLDQLDTFVSNSESKKGEGRLAMLNEDEEIVKIENDWGNPGFEMDLGAANYPSLDTSSHQGESESEEEQNPDMSYAPRSKLRSFNDFKNELIPGPRGPTTSTALSPSAPRTTLLHPIAPSSNQSTPKRAKEPSVPRSSSPTFPNMLSLDEDADNILRFSIPPPNSSRSPTLTRTVSNSPFSAAGSRSSQTPVPKSISPINHTLTLEQDLLRFSVCPSESPASSSSSSQPVLSHPSPSRSSKTPVLRSPTPHLEPFVSFSKRKLSHSPLPNPLPVALQPRPSANTPFLDRKSITLNHTPAPTLSPYVFQPPGTPESYSGSSENDRKMTGMRLSRDDSVDRVFENIDKQWNTGKKGETDHEDDVEISEWARKIRSSLSPDSEDEKSEEGLEGKNDNAAVLRHRVDTQVEGKEMEEEAETEDTVVIEVRRDAQQHREKESNEVFGSTLADGVEEETLSESFHETVEEASEVAVETPLDASPKDQGVSQSVPKVSFHTKTVLAPEIDHSDHHMADKRGSPQVEKPLPRVESILAEECQMVEEDHSRDTRDERELLVTHSEPVVVNLEREQTPIYSQLQVDEQPLEDEPTHFSSVPFLGTEESSQSDHSLASLNQDDLASESSPARLTVTSPSFNHSTSSPNPSLKTSSYHLSHAQHLSTIIHSATTPSLSPPNPIRVNTPSESSSSVPTIKPLKDIASGVTYVHPPNHEERNLNQPAVEERMKSKRDSLAPDQDQGDGAIRSKEATVNANTIDEGHVEDNGDEQITAVPEDPFTVIRSKRRQSLAEEMQAIGEEDYGVFDDTIDFGEEQSSGLKNFMDGFEGDEVVEDDTVEVSVSTARPKIHSKDIQLKGQENLVHQNVGPSADVLRKPYSTPAPVVQQPLTQPASRSWTRTISPSPSPSTDSSISSDTASGTQNFSLLGKTQDFIVELNDITDESLDDQIENIIQERSVQESSFEVSSLDTPVRPPLPNKISSEKLSGINELFRKRHAGGQIAMSTPPPVQSTVSGSVPRPTVSSVPFLPSISSPPSRGAQPISKLLRGGLQFPKELERLQSSASLKSSRTKTPVSLLESIRVDRSSASSEPSTSLASRSNARISPVSSVSVTQPTRSVVLTPVEPIAPAASVRPLATDASRTRYSYTSPNAPPLSTAPSSLNRLSSQRTNVASHMPSKIMAAWTARQRSIPPQSQHDTELPNKSNRVDVSFDQDGEKEEEELETFIKITSNDPKEAARATAFLKLFHDYVETELVPLNPDTSVASAVSTRTQSNYNTSIRSHLNQSIISNANMSIMSAPELLMEAEQEIAADAGPSDEETLNDRVQELSIPGSFNSQSSLKELVDRRAKVRERNLADHVWGPGDWRRLMNCLDAEGGKKNLNIDPERVVTRFIREMALEDKDLVGEWEHSRLILRVTSIQTRRQAEAANPSSRRRRSSINPTRSLISPNKASSSSFTRGNYRSSPLRKSQSLPSELSTEPSFSFTNKIFGFLAKKWRASAAQLEEVVPSDRPSVEVKSFRTRNEHTALSTDSERQPINVRPSSLIIIPPSSPESEPRQAEHPITFEHRQQRRQRPKSTASYSSQSTRVPSRISPSMSSFKTTIPSSLSSSSSSSFRSNAQKTPISQHSSKIQPRPLSIAHLPPRSTLSDTRPTRSPIIHRRQAPSDRSSSFTSSSTSRVFSASNPSPSPMPIPIPIPASTAGAGAEARGKTNDLPVRPRSSFESSPPRVSALVRSFESVGSGPGSLDDVMGGGSGRSGQNRRG